MIEMSLDELERLAKEDLEREKKLFAEGFTGKNPEDVTREDVEKVGDETALSWIELCVELTGELPEKAVVNV